MPVVGDMVCWGVGVQTGDQWNQASTGNGEAGFILSRGAACCTPTNIYRLEPSPEADFTAQGDVLSIAGFAGCRIADYRFGNVLAT